MDDTTVAPMKLDPSFLESIPPEQREWFELMAKDEPLHPDLVPYVQDTEIGKMLRHPLVYESALIGPARINERYAQKVDARARAFAEARWFTYVWVHERPYRLEALLHIAPRMKNGEFWSLARDVWIDSENVFQHATDWLEIFQSDRPGRSQFMTTRERKLLRSLPDELTVYRGCAEFLNDDGLSWSLDQDRAEWFAKRYAPDGYDKVVLTATVPKNRVMAYLKEGRGEEEIVVREPEFVHVTNVRYI